jgi:hypothetical protein
MTTLGGEEYEPGAEVLPVYVHRAGWRGDGQQGDHIPPQASEWARAASLGFLRVSRHDVRPHLLALMRWEVGTAIEPCLSYGRCYLRVWCSRMGQRPRPAVIEAVTVDALALVFWGRCRRGMPTIEERRVELHVDKGRYAEYRALMERVFKRRLSEAATRYKTISHYQPALHADYCSNGLAGSSLWLKAHEKPGAILTLMPAIQPLRSGIINDRQDFTAMIAPVSRSRAA